MPFRAVHIELAAVRQLSYGYTRADLSGAKRGRSRGPPIEKVRP